MILKCILTVLQIEGSSVGWVAVVVVDGVEGDVWIGVVDEEGKVVVELIGELVVISSSPCKQDTLIELSSTQFPAPLSTCQPLFQPVYGHWRCKKSSFLINKGESEKYYRSSIIQSVRYHKAWF